MSAFLAESMILHSGAGSSLDLFDDVFSGRNHLFSLTEKYLPEDFPELRGSVISPSLLGLDDDREYLLNSSLRMRLTLDVLFAGIATAIRDAGHFDAIFLMKSNEAQFDFSKPYSERFFIERFTNKAFGAAVLKHLKELGLKKIGEETIHIIDAACASGHVAAGSVARFFRAGRWNRALLIAIDLISIERIWLLASLGAAARQDAQGEPTFGPFSRERKGFYQSDGAAIVILESENAWRERHTKSSSRVTGIFQNSDAETLTAGSKGGVRLAECMAGALQTQEIHAVKAHGTGTVLNDSAEAGAVHSVFKGQRPKVISLKGQIGHTLTASGLIELLICDEIFRRRRAPACLNLFESDCDLDFIREVQPFTSRKMLLNAFGFGGYNACLILEGL